MKLCLFFFFLLWGFGANARNFEPDSERLMAVSFSDGTPLNDALSVYNQDELWFFPLRAFAESLGLSINVTGNLGQAEGFILQENRKFRLLTSSDGSCQVFLSGVESACEGVVSFADDLWVERKWLERWFPLQIKIDSFGSLVEVTTTELFPAQAKKDRDLQAALAMQSAGDYDPGYPHEKIPHQNLDGFFLDQQLNLARNSVGSQHETALEHSSLVGAEVLGFESRAFLAGDQKQLSEPLVTFAKRDPNGRLLGKLRASELDLMDVNIPSYNLVGAGGSVRGFHVSGYPLSSTSDFQKQDIAGDLQTGWEVELYQNDSLIGRQASSDRGRYLFSGIPLRYGLNQFRLLFYGPQGQRFQETRNFNINSSIAPPGRTSYRVAHGAVVDKSDLKKTQTQAIVERNILGTVSMRAGYIQSTPSKETQPFNYYLTGLRGFYRGLFLYSDAAFSEQRAAAWENGLQQELFGISLGLSHTVLSHFVSDVFERQDDIKYQSKLSTAFQLLNFPTLRLTFDLLRKVNRAGLTLWNLNQRTSLQTGPLYWFNDIGYDWDLGASDFSGKLTNLIYWADLQLRSNMDYNRYMATGVGSVLQYTFTPKWSANIGYSNEFQSETATFTGGVNREFDLARLSVNGSSNSKQESSVSLLVSYSLGRVPPSQSWFVQSTPQADLGAASVRVFLDKNFNGVFDQGDEPLPEARIIVNQQEWAEPATKEGWTFVSRLAPMQPTDISVSLRSLPDPMTKPLKAGVRIVPRAGKTAEVLLPVIFSGEVSGTVRDMTQKGVANVTVLLRREDGSIARETKTESDGFYLLDTILPGVYLVELGNTDLSPKISRHRVEIGESGGYIDNKDFSIRDKMQ